MRKKSSQGAFNFKALKFQLLSQKWQCIHFFLIHLYIFFKAKKRQIQLDTTYGSSMRELELLLDNFQIEKPEEHKRTQGDN